MPSDLFAFILSTETLQDLLDRWGSLAAAPSLRLGPGLHGRGMCAVGRTVVGTAGALFAHSQDTSAEGEGWEVGPILESLKPIMWDHTLRLKTCTTFAEFRV